MKLFRRILHPTDFSKASGPAFRKALELAKQERAELRLVHVLMPPAVLLEDSFMTAKRRGARPGAGPVPGADRPLKRGDQLAEPIDRTSHWC